MESQRDRKRRTLILMGMGGFLIIAGLLVMMRRDGLLHITGPARILAGTAGTAVLVGWWGLFALRLAGAQDEYQRWAVHRAWYCGGLPGLIVSVPVFTFIGLGGLHWLNPATDFGPVAARAFTSGYMLPLMMQVAGSTAWAVWTRFVKK